MVHLVRLDVDNNCRQKSDEPLPPKNSLQQNPDIPQRSGSIDRGALSIAANAFDLGRMKRNRRIEKSDAVVSFGN